MDGPRLERTFDKFAEELPEKTSIAESSAEDRTQWKKIANSTEMTVNGNAVVTTLEMVVNGNAVTKINLDAQMQTSPFVVKWHDEFQGPEGLRAIGLCSLSGSLLIIYPSEKVDTELQVGKGKVMAFYIRHSMYDEPADIETACRRVLLERRGNGSTIYSLEGVASVHYKKGIASRVDVDLQTQKAITVDEESAKLGEEVLREQIASDKEILAKKPGDKLTIWSLERSRDELKKLRNLKTQGKRKPGKIVGSFRIHPYRAPLFRLILL